MQFQLSQLSSRVARRTLLTLLGCGLVPVLAVAGISYQMLSKSLVQEASNQVAAETDAHAALLTDRVERLVNVLHGSIDSVPLGYTGSPLRTLASRVRFDVRW